MEEKVARLIECERILRRTHAEQLRLIAELNVDEFAAVDVSLALQLSPVNAQWLMGRATELVEVFPDALEALGSGVISERSVHGMIDNTLGWRPELAQRPSPRPWRPPPAAAPNSFGGRCWVVCNAPIRRSMRVVGRNAVGIAR